MLTLEYLEKLRVTQFRVKGISLITLCNDRACIADLAADPGKQSSDEMRTGGRTFAKWRFRKGPWGHMGMTGICQGSQIRINYVGSLLAWSLGVRVCKLEVMPPSPSFLNGPVGLSKWWGGGRRRQSQNVAYPHDPPLQPPGAGEANTPVLWVLATLSTANMSDHIPLSAKKRIQNLVRAPLSASILVWG